MDQYPKTREEYFHSKKRVWFMPPLIQFIYFSVILFASLVLSVFVGVLLNELLGGEAGFISLLVGIFVFIACLIFPFRFAHRHMRRHWISPGED